MSVDDETEFMEEDNDRGGEEGEGMDQHKSVIVHLIKQVRIGMDLTKGKNFKRFCQISGIIERCLFRSTCSYVPVRYEFPLKTDPTSTWSLLGQSV